jgi:endoglucanase
MRIITLILIFLVSTLGSAQELLTNGDFETGDTTGWTGNAANVVTEGGNSYNSANVETAGNPWDVNLSQVLALTQGTTYRLTFDAWSDQMRTMVAGIGLNEAPYTNSTQTVNLVNGSQNYELNFVANFDSANSRVLFDMGADTGFVGIDNVSLIEVAATCSDGLQNGDEEGVDCGGSNCDPCSTPEPTTAAPTPPARPAADVISLFSNAYTNIDVAEWSTSWDMADIEDVQIEGDDTKKITFDAFLGIQLTTEIDLSTFTHFHMDFWVADELTAGEVLNPKLSNHGNLPGSDGETNAVIYTNPVTNSQQWVSLDVALDDFSIAGGGSSARDKIYQILLDVSSTLDIVYMDNMYFHKNTTMSTASFEAGNFNVYPNPSLNQWTINSQDITINSILVFDMLGKQVLSLQPNATQATIDGNRLNNGVYFAVINTDKGTSSTKLIKE